MVMNLMDRLARDSLALSGALVRLQQNFGTNADLMVTRLDRNVSLRKGITMYTRIKKNALSMNKIRLKVIRDF